MQAESEEDRDADETEDELDEDDLQDAIRASLRASFAEDSLYGMSLAQADTRMTGENVTSDEAAARVENLHEYVGLGIIHEGDLNVSVDSDPGTAPHDPFHLEDDKSHVSHGHFSVFLGSPVRCF